MYCENCGKEIESQENKFCTHCGSEIKHELIEKNSSLNQEDNEISKSDYTEENAVEILNTKDTKESDIIATLDWFDKWIGIKGEYNNSELAEKRFKTAYQALYIYSIFNIVIGYFLSSNLTTINNDFSLVDFGANVFYGGLFYLFLTFSFQKLKMPLMLGFLAMGMLADKIFTMISIARPSGLGIIVSILLFVVMFQAFRSKKYLKTTSHKILKRIIGSILFILFGLAILGTIYPDAFEDKEWDKEKTLIFKNAIYDGYANILLKGENLNNTKIKTLIENTSECSINGIKNKFPNYANFVAALESKENNLVKQEIAKIKDECFNTSLKNK